MFTLSHQSMADLEFVSREFATAVWDNTGARGPAGRPGPSLAGEGSGRGGGPPGHSLPGKPR
jgi:hypothetical protein